MPQAVLYEEEGSFKVGTVLADHDTSLQVEAPHGKRSKVKASAVLLRFEAPGLAHFMEEAGRIAEELDVDFLWQCSGQSEFGFDALAREYYGRAPAPVESAGLLMKLHGAPMYFYRRGRGRYQPAPPEALRAALASLERRRREAEQRAEYVAELVAGRLPPPLERARRELLYRPDRRSLEWKALEEAGAQLKLSPARVFERCGALPSSHDYHMERFLFEHFPRGTAFPDIPPPEPPADLPVADVEAFSIDDVTTTEIDDALSVTPRPGGAQRVGVHIALPAAGIPAGSALDAVARERLSTVYFPGGKITMLPPAAISVYTLAADGLRPVLSHYLDVAPDGTIEARETRIERVRIAQNYDHAGLEEAFNEEALASGQLAHARAEELTALWRLARALEIARRGDVPEPEPRAEYNFYVENDRVRIVPRRRGSPVDRIVSELMIQVNSAWGRDLAAAGLAAIYRVQSGGKVRLSTAPLEHEGLGVEAYAWSSSPLRRYVDLVNQRQLVALVRGEPAPYRSGDESLLAAVRDFELAHDAYAEHQRLMERYWCLRWLLQEDARIVPATVIRESLVRCDPLPLVARVPSLPALPAGTPVEIEVADIDLIELTFRAEYRRPRGTPAS